MASAIWVEVPTVRLELFVSDQAIDRSTLPIRRPPFQGVTKRTLEASQPDWNHAVPLTPSRLGWAA
jgi:hypothetical protein